VTKPLSRSELGRLGKRGSYRLGLLAPQGIAAPAPPRPFRPSFGKQRHLGATSAWVFSGLAATAMIAAGAIAGLWFVPLIIGFIAGICARWGGWRLRVMAWAVLAMCAGGWGAALAALAARGLPIGATARTIAAVAGLPAYAAVAVGGTVAIAVVQGLVGLWLGRALTPLRAR
jgi:hypothetical protein